MLNFLLLEMRCFALGAGRHFLGSGEGIFLSCERVAFPYQKYDFLHWRLASYFWAVEKGFPPMGLAASRLFPVEKGFFFL